MTYLRLRRMKLDKNFVKLKNYKKQQKKVSDILTSNLLLRATHN